jgi:hypothetical protein
MAELCTLARIRKQKELTDKILAKLKIVDPYCILAGGAPRDWYFNEPANDLDFYFTSTAKTLDSVVKQLEFVTEEPVMLLGECCEGEHKDMYKHMKNLRRISQTEVGGMKVQFIQLQNPSDTFKVTDAMSCSICKVWYLPEKGIMRERDFKLTEASKTMFLSDGYKWSDPHPAKMMQRFGVNCKFNCGTKEQATNRLVSDKLSGL